MILWPTGGIWSMWDGADRPMAEAAPLQTGQELEFEFTPERTQTQPTQSPERTALRLQAAEAESDEPQSQTSGADSKIGLYFSLLASVPQLTIFRRYAGMHTQVAIDRHFMGTVQTDVALTVRAEWPEVPSDLPALVSDSDEDTNNELPGLITDSDEDSEEDAFLDP